MAKYPTFEPDPPMLTGNEIRRLYESAPSPATHAMAWEIWRLRRRIIDLYEDMGMAQRFGSRTDVVAWLLETAEELKTEPCVIESRKTDFRAEFREKVKNITKADRERKGKTGLDI